MNNATTINKSRIYYFSSPDLTWSEYGHCLPHCSKCFLDWLVLIATHVVLCASPYRDKSVLTRTFFYIIAVVVIIIIANQTADTQPERNNVLTNTTPKWPHFELRSNTIILGVGQENYFVLPPRAVSTTTTIYLTIDAGTLHITTSSTFRRHTAFWSVSY